MFSDGRSKRVIFIAHCLLNQNTISDGTAVYPAAFRGLIDALLIENIGIVQLPCPELCCLGLDRGNVRGAESPVTAENTRIRREMESGTTCEALSRLVEYAMRQILEYNKHGFELVGIIGANRSPNCGVETTSENGEETSGMGIFMEKISHRLTEENIDVPMVGIKSENDIAEKLLRIIGR